MYITRTPFRISFFGGGTDFEDYYVRNGGCVLSTTIDKYCYVTLRNLPDLFPYKNQLTYSKIERFNDFSEVRHPLVRETLKYLPVDRIQISYDADLPAGSGIGSSSAFAVGLLQGLHAMKNEFPDRMTLAKEAIHIERDMCGEAGGVQDQLAAAFGGFNKISFDSDGFTVEPVNIGEEKKQLLQDNLMMVFTGFTHYAGEISAKQKDNISSSLNNLDRMKELVTEAEKILESGDTDDFGRLLNYTWELKKTLSDKITNAEIDNMYNLAMKNGALGGKVLGAGSGGFMLLYVPKEKQEKIRNIFKDNMFVPFSFENTGTMILHHNSNRE